MLRAALSDAVWSPVAATDGSSVPSGAGMKPQRAMSAGALLGGQGVRGQGAQPHVQGARPGARPADLPPVDTIYCLGKNLATDHQRRVHAAMVAKKPLVLLAKGEQYVSKKWETIARP